MKTLKQFIFQKMAEGYMTDKDLSEFIKSTKGEEYYKEHDLPYCQAEVYKREYQALENAKNEFDDCEDIVISSYRNSYKGAKTRYNLRHKGMVENQWWKIPKIYFEHLKEKGVKIYK